MKLNFKMKILLNLRLCQSYDMQEIQNKQLEFLYSGTLII